GGDLADLSRRSRTHQPRLPTLDPLMVEPPAVQGMVDRYCVRCHSERRDIADMALDTLDAATPTAAPGGWENVASKLWTGTMPPAGAPRPDDALYDEVAEWLEGRLDEAWASDVQPGRINSIHRMNRMEYNNAIQDLLGLDIDVTDQLPGDETADGTFDNV